jgi:hypothetical protein
VVTLTGTVEVRWMKHRAEDIAEAVGGVEDVENRIRVIRPGTRDRQPGDGGGLDSTHGSSTDA